MVLKGQHIDMAELGNNRVWQKSGSIIAGAVYGIAFASFLGIIFVYIRKSLPGSNNKRKALVFGRNFMGSDIFGSIIKISSKSACSE